MCPELVVVPAGKFTMGSPSDEHERLGGEVEISVSISQPFAAGTLLASSSPPPLVLGHYPNTGRRFSGRQSDKILSARPAVSGQRV